MMVIIGKIALGLVPALLYLGALVVLDSYKLVRLRTVLAGLAAGCLALVFCNYLNAWLLGITGLSVPHFSRYLAPVTEEAAKAVFLVWLIRRRRIGFMVDAAIVGFASGAGFGILENIFYLHQIPEANVVTWVLRGCGTALMHGTTVAILALIYHTRGPDPDRVRGLRLLTAFAIAVVVHSLYNHFLVSPMVAALALVLGVPLITVAVYGRSEKALEKWLGTGFDTDAEMLAIIAEGRLSETPVGIYLMELRERFPAVVVVDMFCLLRVQTELAIEAKGVLMMRKQGIELPPRPGLQEKIEELHHLEKNIGPTGRLALQPLRKGGVRDTWEKHLLQGS